MPVIVDVRLHLSTEQVLRGLRMCYTSKMQPQVIGIFHQLLSSVSELLTPAFAYQLYLLAGINGDLLCLESGIAFHGSAVTQFLAGARQIAAVVSTIGPRLETKVDKYFAHDEQLRGLILDDIGTAALDSLTMEICQFMKRVASTQGYEAGGPLSPGQLDWPLIEQRQLFQLVPADQIGVRLTSSGMMVPRKSISMVIGMGAKIRTWTQAEICARCSLRETCSIECTRN